MLLQDFGKTAQRRTLMLQRFLHFGDLGLNAFPNRPCIVETLIDQGLEVAQTGIDRLNCDDQPINFILKRVSRVVAHYIPPVIDLTRCPGITS
jgi:hypothetical protein